MTASTNRPVNLPVVFGVVLIGALAYSLLMSMVFPALSTLAVSLHTSTDTASWILTAYLLAAAVATPIVGRIGDLYGKERMLIVSFALLTLGTAIDGLSNSIGLTIAGRVLQGLGAGVVPLSFGLIRDVFPPKRVGGAVGFTAALMSIGAGIGMVVAGPIVTYLGFHWLFWIPMIMTSTAMAALIFLIPRRTGSRDGTVNVLAALLLSLWLLCLLVGVTEGPAWGWGSLRVVGLFVASAVLFVGWIAYESRSASPLIDMKMMRERTVFTTNTVALFFGVTMYACAVAIPEFLEVPLISGYGFGASVLRAGIFFAPQAFFMFVVSMGAGRIARTIGSKNAVVIGSVFSALGYFALAFFHSAAWQIYLENAVLGIGMGFAFSAIAFLIVESVDPSQTAVASGMNVNIRTIGGALGSAIVASIVTSDLSANGIPRESAFVASFLFLAVVSILSLAAAIMIPKRTQHDRDVDRQPHEIHAEAAVITGATLADS